MSSRGIHLSEVGRALGEGWCVFTSGAVHGERLREPSGSLGISGEPYPDMNTGIIFREQEAGVTLRRFVTLLRSRGLPGEVAVLSTAAGQAAAVAEELGLGGGHALPLMCVRAADARRAEHAYVVRRVEDQAGVDAAADVLGDAFEVSVDWCRAMLGPAFAQLPGADLFAAWHHGQAVAVVGTGRVGATVGVYAVGTRRSHRRRGAASAALSAAVDHHVRGGAHLFCLLSATKAEPLYAGLGFVAVDHPVLWRVPAT